MENNMNGTVKIIYWQDGDHWLGYVEEYPDYMTQGLSLPELKENLKDLYMAQPVPRHNEI
jgi:predicted RNase H-like HicB family nuclease